MKLAFSSIIAKRYLLAKHSEAFISLVSIFALLGVALGVAVLIVTMSIMGGFERELRDKLVGPSHIYISQLGTPISNWSQLEPVIREVEGVTLAAPFTQEQILISVNGRSQGVLLKGFVANSPTAKELQGLKVDSKALADLLVAQSTLPGIILGADLANKLNLQVGDSIALLTSKLASGPFGLAPRSKRFQVVALFDSNLAGYEDGLAYCYLPDLQQFTRQLSAFGGIEISTNNPNQAGAIAKAISQKLASKDLGGFYVQDWTEFNRGLWEAIRLEKQVYFWILLLLIVLASFSIVTSLVMIVLEKRKDIAIMRTFGASTKQIRSIFITIGMAIGVAGTLLGVFLGYLGAWLLQTYGFPLPKNVFPTDTVPIEMSLINFVVVAFAAILISLLATIYPARRACQLQPNEIFRYQ